MQDNDPFALMKELTETFEKGNTGADEYQLGQGGFKSLINKPSNVTDLYQKSSFNTEINGSFRKNEVSSLPAASCVRDDLQKMREKRGLGGLADVFGETKRKEKSQGAGALKDLVQNESIFEAAQSRTGQ